MANDRNKDRGKRGADLKRIPKPRACIFCVEMPNSTPSPNSPPSVNCVEAFTYTAAASITCRNCRARA